MTSMITTHVLDTGRGRPAAGVPVSLFHGEQLLAQALTNEDGRVTDLGPDRVGPGTYQLVFDVAEYDPDGFFPEVRVVFRVTDGRHYHVPVLLSPYAYSTYRGS